ncbi:hypothetical protein MVEG_09111 [Podila verticillata NRRL 6337]|nr:hypothetical protein MVEG_09111 [Podila verticillata NRRL 6337]
MTSQTPYQYAPPVYYPSQPVHYPPQPVQYPPQPVQYPPQPVQYPPQPVQYPQQPVQYPQQPVQYPQQPLPFLDHQKNPTQALVAFANALFDHLDRSYEPKGTQLLEETKMIAMALLMSSEPVESISKQNKIHLTWILNLTYLAFSAETVFTDNGPSVTRGGFMTFLRNEIAADPDEAFKDYTKVNQALRLVSPIARSQLPELPDRQLKDIQDRIQKHATKKMLELSTSGAGHSNFDEDMERLKVQGQRNALANMRVQMSRNQIARMENAIEQTGRLGSNFLVNQALD